jgi:hypothetical protein
MFNNKKRNYLSLAVKYYFKIHFLPLFLKKIIME